MSIVGIGTDIVHVSIFEPENIGAKARVFTQHEREYCLDKWYPAQHYAARWAAKEAVLKALNLEFKFMSQVGVVSEKDQPPQIELSFELLEMLNHPGLPEIKIHVSLSHTNSQAVAYVIAER